MKKAKYKATIRTEVLMTKEQYRKYLLEQADMYGRLVEDAETRLKKWNERSQHKINQYIEKRLSYLQKSKDLK